MNDISTENRVAFIVVNSYETFNLCKKIGFIFHKNTQNSFSIQGKTIQKSLKNFMYVIFSTYNYAQIRHHTTQLTTTLLPLVNS